MYYGDAMEREKVRSYVNRYCHLRDVQYAAYTNYARRFGLTTNELFVLDIIWFCAGGLHTGGNLHAHVGNQADNQRHY